MRSHRCGALSVRDEGRRVQLAGWVHRARDLGGVTFVDLRDRSGIVQLVLRASPEGHGLSREDVVRVEGVVGRREAPNPDLPTGEVEVVVERLSVCSRAKPLPFAIDEDEVRAGEETRLRFRFLDLRRDRLQRSLTLRHRTCFEIRRYLDGEGFVEVETPMLTRSTPEGARDFLVPSRVNQGSFYALPQSPQLFKQILMCSGVERYFQIVRCFRDEDLRADRQPEFTQLDMEMAFVERPEDLFPLFEGVMAHVFRAVLGLELATPFPRLPYEEAMTRYGTDKPDLRIGTEIVDVSDVFARSGFRAFAAAVADGGVVRALSVPGAAEMSRGELGRLEEEAKGLGAPGLAWLKLEEEIRSPIAKFVDAGQLRAVAERAGAETGDLVVLSAGPADDVGRALGDLRVRLAAARDLPHRLPWAPLWVVDFPLFKRGEDGSLESEHHPFTSPRDEELAKLEADPLSVKAKCYDLVLNGVELASGSIRIHRRELQQQVFDLLGITPEEADRRFGFFLRALDYGAPPHGGIAFGLDRWVMMMAGERSLRDVIAFPKTTTGACPLTGAPSEVDEAQLAELGLQRAQRHAKPSG